MVDLFTVFIVAFFAVVGLYTLAIAYVVRMLRRLEDAVKAFEETS